MHRLQCFGSATVFDSDGCEVHFRSRKHLGLLLYLCTHSNRSLTRSHLAALFWETEEPLARHSLSQALYDVKKRLRPLQLHTHAGSLRIGRGQILYEADEFEACVKREELERAVELYRGQYAPNLDGNGTRRFQRWLETERTRFATVGQAALRQYVAACDRKGQWGEVCLAALRLVKLDPLDEAGHRALMKALWLQGDQHSALQHYAEVEELLLRELPEGPARETIELVGRIRSSRPPAVDLRPEPETMLPLVGRAVEFEALRSAFRRLRRQKTGRVVVVRGEAGIGKTRLLQELGNVSAVEGLTYLESRCYPAEADVAYGPVLDAIEPVATRIADDVSDRDAGYYQLGHLFPRLFGGRPVEEAESIDPDVRRRRLFEEVADLVRRPLRRGPMVWVVEDIQWIDAASASLLHYIVRRLRDRPLLLVLSLRTGQPIRETARVLTEEVGPHLVTETIELKPLPSGSIRELLEAVSESGRSQRAVSFAQRYSGGNPFYALEILRAAMEWRSRNEFPPVHDFISDRLRNLLTLRLRGLSSRSLRVLEAVAVLGRYASPMNVAAAAGLTNDCTAPITEELRGRHLLRERDGTVEFAHDITREFVYSNLGLLQRSALHLTVAEVLAGDEQVNPATLARHFERGGDRPRAYEFGMQAARASSSSSAHSEAAALAALAASVAADAEARFEALRLQAEAELAAGRFGDAERHFDAILSLYPELPPDRRVPLRLSILKAKVETSDWPGASSCLRVLEREVRSVEHAAQRVEWELEARALMLKVAILTKDDVRARRTNEVIRERAGEAEATGALTPQAQAEALCSQIVYATFFESSKRAAEMLAHVSRLDEERVSPRLKQQSVQLRGMVALRLGRWDEAAAALGDSLVLARSAKDIIGEANALNNLACVSLEQGEWSEAEQRCEAAQRLLRSVSLDDYSAICPSLNLASVCFYKGDSRRARRLYQDLWSVATAGSDPHAQAEALAGLGLISLQCGAWLEAQSLAEELNRLGPPDALRGQQRYKVSWAWAFLGQLELLPHITGLLKLTANAEHDLDYISYLKLSWLDELLAPSDSSSTPETENLLRQSGLAWFVRFTNRWFRLASATRRPGDRQRTRI